MWSISVPPLSHNVVHIVLQFHNLQPEKEKIFFVCVKFKHSLSNHSMKATE